MINSLHKKIALVLLFITQITVPMEQQGLSLCNNIGEVMTVFNFYAQFPMLFYLSGKFDDKILQRGTIYTALILETVLMLLLKSDKIAQCGRNGQVVTAECVTGLSILTSLFFQTKFIHGRAIDQLKQDNKPKNKLIWEFFKQVDCWDFLTYVMGVGLLSVLFGMPTS